VANSTWAITGLGELSTVGIENMLRVRSNMADDEVTFDAPGDMDGAALIAYGETVAITKDGAPWFVGRCVSIPRIGTFTEEKISYRVLGPWHHLNNCTYQQSWQLHLDGAVTSAFKSRAILGQDVNGNTITNLAEVRDIVEFAKSKGAPISVGSIDTGINMPYEEVRDLMCAQAIIRCARWTPDAVGWMDYSEGGDPSFSCRRRSNLTAVTIAISDAQAAAINIRRRDDLLVPGIKIIYETNIEADGLYYQTIETDSAGTTTDLFAKIFTVELTGSMTSQNNLPTWEVETAPVGLAAAIYATYGTPYYQGSITIEEDEVSGSWGPGNLLNISGGASEWADMSAVIQRVSEQVDSGTTTIEFGPPTQLGPDDLLSLMRTFSMRNVPSNEKSRTTGVTSHRWLKLQFPGGNGVTLDPQDVTFAEQIFKAHAVGSNIDTTFGWPRYVVD